MPITLEKLLSPTAESSFEFMGETVTVTFAPMRYTGEMQTFAEKLTDEQTAENEAIAALREEADGLIAADGDKKAKAAAAARAAEIRAKASEREAALDLRDRRALRDTLSKLLVGWDVMEGRKALGVDRETLDRLPDLFLRVVFLNLARENQPDPTKAPRSSEP